MNLPKRTLLPHDTPNWVEPGALFFLTVCCEPRGTNQLCREEVARHLFEAVEFRHARRTWNVRLLLLMPDHWHGLVSFPREEHMERVLSNFKEVTAKKAGVSWQRGFFDHRLRNDESIDEKAHYIRMNPVRKGLVATPEEWAWVWTPDAAGPALSPLIETPNPDGGPSGPALPRR
jgi:putative transposase